MPDRYFVNGGLDNNWGSTSNWSATSGGSGGASVPTSVDDVFFDSNSPNVTVNAVARATRNLNFTGYSNTITMTFSITSSGSVTLVNAMTIAGVGSLIVNAAATLTSNGRTWPNALLMQAGVTYTFADAWVCNGLVTIGSGPSFTTCNGNQITCNAGFTNGTANGSIGGTTKVVLAGGTITSTSVGSISFSFDYAGDIIFPSGTLWTLAGGTQTYTGGTVTFAGTHLLTILGNCTFDTGNFIVWKDFTVSSNNLTLELTSDIRCEGNFTASGGNRTYTVNGGTIFVGKDFLFNSSASTVLNGTGRIIMNGTGTISQGGGVSTGFFPLIIDTTGHYTIASKFNWDMTKFVVRRAGSITTSEVWGLGGGGGSYSPIDNILIG